MELLRRPAQQPTTGVAQIVHRNLYSALQSLDPSEPNQREQLPTQLCFRTSES